MEWDFADQSKRDSEIEDAVSVIRRIIFPFFALFDDPPSAVDILMQRGAFSEMSLLEYALMELGPLAAEKAGRSFLTTNPQISERHETAFRKFAREGLPAYRSDTGSDFAALAVATGLDFTPEN